MNKVIKELLATGKPKIKCMDVEERKIYEAGLGVFGCIIADDFFDLPKLPADKYATDGLFYEVPYYEAEQLLCMDNQRFLLVIYHIKNRSSFCPLRIDFKLIDRNNYAFYVYVQWGEQLEKREFFSCENGEWFTQYTNYNKLKLSDLLDGYDADEAI